MAGRYSARGVDKDAGWIERRFREAFQQIAELRVGKISAVPGSVVTIHQIMTNPSSTSGFRNTDTAVATGSGDLTLYLTYLPLPGSLQVWWGSVPQPPTEWSVADNVVTIPDPDDWIVAGHVFTAYYAYAKAEVTAAVVDSGPLDWGSSGPMLTVVEGDTTNYSAPGFDDSGWTSAAAPAGYPLGENSGQPTWPDVVFSTASSDAGVWLRRTVTVTEPSTLDVTARVDGQWWLYCDGVLLASNPTLSGTAEVGPYSASVGTGDHVIALHVNDDTADPGSDFLYADVNVAVS